MRNDHYVARTYLKHFAGPKGLLHAYRKSDEKDFPTRPQDVCHAPDDDLILDFTADPEILGKYRRLFEPEWNFALESIRQRAPDMKDKMRIAGYWAQLLVGTPTWRRVGVDMHNGFTHNYARAHTILSAEHGKADPRLVDAVEMLDDGRLQVETNPNYVRAQAVRSAIGYAWAIYNADWTVMESDTDVEFITSDNPAACEDQGGAWAMAPRPYIRYLPISPALCLVTDLSASWDRHRRSVPDFSKPPEGRIRGGLVSPYRVRNANHWIAKCAEDVVLSSKSDDGIRGLVRKYSRFRVENESIQMRRGNSILIGARMRVVERRHS